MKYDHERFSNLYATQTAVLDNKEAATIDLSEENPTLFKAGMPRKQAPEQLNLFQVFVRGGMHQPIEE